MVLFHYDTSKSAQVAETLLAGYAGFLQVDGNATYGTLARAHPDIQLMGCIAHARRKFFEADKARGKKGPAGRARKGVSMIQKLYGIEQSVKDKTPEKQRARAEQAVAVLEELHAWALQSVEQVVPTLLTGKALRYLLEQWPKLIRYVDDGRLPSDNNATERAIRTFVIGRRYVQSWIMCTWRAFHKRRNWLFADTPNGATASANLYSLIETAKANGIEPYFYLRHLFTALPAAQTAVQLEALLPLNLDGAGLASDALTQ